LPAISDCTFRHTPRKIAKAPGPSRVLRLERLAYRGRAELKFSIWIPIQILIHRGTGKNAGEGLASEARPSVWRRPAALAATGQTEPSLVF
jgi:hypothetical protein